MRPPRELRVNFAFIACAALFWLFVAMRGPWQAGPAGYAAAALAASIFLYFAQQLNNEAFLFKLKLDHLTLRDCAFMAFFLIIISLLTAPRLGQDLWSDQVYNASLSNRLAQLGLFKIRADWPALWAAIANVDARIVLWALNAAAAALFAALFLGGRALFRRQPLLLGLVWLAAAAGAGAVLAPDGALFSGLGAPVLLADAPGDDPHPALRLAPLWLASALFGPNAAAFRLAGFLAAASAMIVLYAALRRRVSAEMAGLAALALSTVPAFWHTAYLVESSIWPALAGALLFAALAGEKAQEAPLVPAAMAALAASYMREPGFLALIPLLGLLVARLIERPIARGEFLAVVFLIGLALAGAAKTILAGTPAVGQTPALPQALSALVNNVPFMALIAACGLAPFFLLGFALRADSAPRLVAAATVCLFLVVAVAVFYGPTRPVLWGVSRYQAEIGAPLIAAGIVAFAIEASRARPMLSFRARPVAPPPSVLRLLTAAPLAVVIAFNLFAIVSFDKNKRRYFETPTPGQSLKSEGEYSIGEAFDFVRREAALDGLYYVGIWYGGFQGALQGLTAEEFARYSALNQRHRAGWSVNLDAVIADRDIAAVLVEVDAPFGALEPLAAAGWARTNFVHPRSGLTMAAFLRPSR